MVVRSVLVIAALVAVACSGQPPSSAGDRDAPSVTPAEAPQDATTSTRVTDPAPDTQMFTQTNASRVSLPSQRLTAVPSVKRRGRSAVDLVLHVTPHPGIHLYAPGAKGYTTVTLTVSESAGVTIGMPKYPAPEDYYFEPTQEHLPVYQSPFDIVIPTTIGADTDAVGATLTYQGCDDRLCYPAQTLPVTFDLSAEER